MSRIAIAFALAVSALSIGLFPALASARDKHVDCNKHGTISDALARLDPAETNTVRVRGYCHENLVISGFDGLSLIAEPGTVIYDASGGKATVVQITGSRKVVVKGFIIRGGNAGLDCVELSYCNLIGVTVEQSNRGVFIGTGEGKLFDVTVRDIAYVGILAFHSTVHATNVSISNITAGDGLSLNGSLFGCQNCTVQQAAGGGLLVQYGSHAAFGPLPGTESGLTVTESALGIVVSKVSSAVLSGATVTDNQGYGLQAEDFAYVEINNGKFVRNGGYDISCGQYWAGRVTGPVEIGSTNCQPPTVP
jgi:hypothetical protein